MQGWQYENNVIGSSWMNHTHHDTIKTRFTRVVSKQCSTFAITNTRLAMGDTTRTALTVTTEEDLGTKDASKERIHEH